MNRQMYHLLLAQEYSLGQWMLVFYMCSFLGWCWEVGLSFVKQHRFVNRGFLRGPILPIYGFGAVVILICCLPFKQIPLLTALSGMAAATLLEWVTGMTMEWLFHVRYWDYSDQPFNVGGHICLLASVTWAVFSVLLVCVIHPKIHAYLASVPPKTALWLGGMMTAAAVVDLVDSVRRAIHFKELLKSMERYAKEIEQLHEAMDRLSVRIGAAAEKVQHKAAQGSLRADVLRHGLRRQRRVIFDRLERQTIGEWQAMRERLSGAEQMIRRAKLHALDEQELIEQMTALRLKAEKLFAQREERMGRGIRHAARVLRMNPTALSRRYRSGMDELRKRIGKHS